MKKKNKISSVLFSSCALIGSYSLLSLDLFDKLFNPKFNKKDPKDEYKSYMSNKKIDDVYINSFDGLKLHGKLVLNNNNHKFIILIHDIYENIEDDYEYIYHFDKYDYNYLLIDNRGYGLSQGKYTTYGLKESFDLISWINYLISYDNNSNICLLAKGVGATASMILLNSKIDSNLKCIVEFGGYSSINSLFNKLPMNKRLLLTGVDVILNNKEKILFKDISCISAIKNNTLPICFVHNKDDQCVDYQECLKLYNLNKGDKKIYPLSGKHLETSINFYKNINSFILEHFDK